MKPQNAGGQGVTSGRAWGCAPCEQRVTVSQLMFDQAFFDGEFAETALEFVREHEGLAIAVEFVTSSGQRLDVLEVLTSDEGVRLVTREEWLEAFLPYAQIVHVNVSPPQRSPDGELPSGNERRVINSDSSLGSVQPARVQLPLLDPLPRRLRVPWPHGRG